MDKEYLEAVDRVCLDCAFGDEDACPTCPVRKTIDLAKMGSREADLINYNLTKMHSCPFPDESGMNSGQCPGFRSDSCRLCIYENTDKLLK